MISTRKTGAIWLSLLVLLMSPGVAWAEKTVNHGWEIVWDDKAATARHVESGKEITLFKDEKSDAEGDRHENNYTMLSVVGTILSWEFTWIGQDMVRRDSGSKYVTVDLTKLDLDNPADKYGRFPGVSLAELFGDKAVHAQLAGNSVVTDAVAEARRAKGEAEGPLPKTLSGLLEAADGGCLADLTDNMLTRFRFLHRLGGDIAAVEVRLSPYCETDQGEIYALSLLHLPIPKDMARDFERAVRKGTLEQRDFTKPSFDCNKAGTVIEFAICTEPALARLDVEMGKAYREARRKNRQQARQAQREWVAERNRECAGGDIGCLTASYEKRLAELR